jgi:hypothetical protein
MVPYGNCSKSPLDHPPEGAIGFAGTVLTSKPIKCGTQIRVEISRSTSPLPAIVEVAVRVCLYWHGKIGDAISAAVFDRPSQDGIYGAYGCWG